MKLLTRKETADLLRLSAPTLWRLRKSDVTFPNPVKISDRRIAFIESEILAWVESRHA